MNRPIRLWVAAAGIALACAIGLAIGAHMVAGSDDAAFGKRVRAYVLAHPEIVAEAAERLRIGPVREAVETPFPGAWAGNPHGDVTLVMFTDYNCPYCRASAPEIDRLLASDPNIKVVWREMPVLGPGSDEAAAAALAAARQGKYLPFHRALFSGGHPDQNGVAAAAKTVGLSPASLIAGGKTPEVQAEIATNLSIAHRLGIGATPFFIIGNRTHEGALGYDALAAAVAEARAGAQ
ncbi:MAG TPA: DsbA family protein [Sphingomonas sp.]|uniref:DsbA family protein n=1 Tax=Sphingomonas sp. TaxID=28214 RepID=UPI002BCC5752|nr:DsbA family protein [Sphingomonas sp.]HMI20044.1 DsbA family protein [Sphingomonas sp.]